MARTAHATAHIAMRVHLLLWASRRSLDIPCSRVPCGSSARLRGRPLLTLMRGDGLQNLLFHVLHIEAGALLHRRELDERLGVLRHLLLYEDEAPELKNEPIVIGQGSRQSGPLERVEAQVDEKRPIDLDRPAKPP